MTAGRRTLVEQWRAYGARPPLERWVSRLSMLAGVAIAAALVLVVLGLAAVAVRGVWRWLVG